MTKEELFNELDSIIGNGCLSDDIHNCKFYENCQEHEKVKAIEVIETYTKQIRADAINEIHTDLITEIALLNETDMTSENLYTFAVRIKEIADKLLQDRIFKERNNE